MEKRCLLILLFLLTQCLSKPEPQPLQIKFDYSHLDLENSYIKKLMKIEFEKISNNFKNLFSIKPNSYLNKMKKRSRDNIIQCEKNEIELEYDKSRIEKTTSLLIFPKITIDSSSKIKNNPQPIECIHKDANTVVLILDFQYKSLKSMKNIVPLNIKNQRYQWLTIRYILSSLGFNANNFEEKKIINNVLYKDKNPLKKYSFYKAYEKFRFLSKTISNKANKKDKYINLWPNFSHFSDVMKENMNPKVFSPSITEMTLNAMESLGYNVNICELVAFNNKCYRPNQKCFNQFEYENYYLHYALDGNGKRWICYYKTEEHFKNKQCSKDYGVLISNGEFNKKYLIDFSRTKDYQNLILLKPAPTCPKPHPRTIYFMAVKDKEDPYQYKYLDRTEEVTIKDPNYFVVTNTFSNYYNIKYLTAKYNDILTNNTKGWNFNYLWKVTEDKYCQELHLKENKYQLIGNFPVDNTFKDGLNRFYNKKKAKFPNDYNYIPETYLFPEQNDLIIKKFKNYHYNPKDAWLFKPARDSFGRGIFVIDNFTEIQKIKQKKYLISRYVMNPLLIKGKKFDMRAYVLVTGMDPLKIYFYRDGYLKLTVKNFTLDRNHLTDGCVHITTSDTNLECFDGKEYKYDTTIYDANSNFYSYVHFERYCAKHGINYTYIMEQFKDIFVKTFISLNSNFLELIKQKKLYDKNLYQLYGLDLIVDANSRVHLLELNRDPSMRNGHAVCDYMYDNIIADILNIVGIVPFNHNKTQETFDKDVYKYQNEIEEKVDDALCEFGRPRGMFELVYPLKKNVETYRKFYDKITPASSKLWDKLLKSNGEFD